MVHNSLFPPEISSLVTQAGALCTCMAGSGGTPAKSEFHFSSFYFSLFQPRSKHTGAVKKQRSFNRTEPNIRTRFVLKSQNGVFFSFFPPPPPPPPNLLCLLFLFRNACKQSSPLPPLPPSSPSPLPRRPRSDLFFISMIRSKHIKGYRERCLLGQKTTTYFRGKTPFPATKR